MHSFEKCLLDLGHALPDPPHVGRIDARVVVEQHRHALEIENERNDSRRRNAEASKWEQKVEAKDKIIAVPRFVQNSGVALPDLSSMVAT